MDTTAVPPPSPSKRGAMRRVWQVVPILAVAFMAFIGPLYYQHEPKPEEIVDNGPINPGDTAWMLMSTALVLLMTPGLSFFYGGMVRPKNIVATMLQSYVALGVITMVWILYGFSLSFGEDGGRFIGNPATYFMWRGVAGHTDPLLSPTVPLIIFALFQLKFAIITPALITGAFAERISFGGYILFMILYSTFVYCPIAHWTWHPEGFFRHWGVLDFAGGAVVHMSSGFAALAGSLVLGKRKEQVSEPANIGFVLLGTGMLWFGWFGFNAGSALAANELAGSAFATTNTASAAAMIAWMAIEHAVRGKATASGCCVGAVVGLVAITPAAGFVTVGESICIGAVAACFSFGAVLLKHKLKLDDTLDVFPCHGVGGIVGTIMTGVFAKDVGLTSGKGKTFGYQWLCVLITFAWSFFVSLICYYVVNFIHPLRVSEEDEYRGLDLSQHGECIGPMIVVPPTVPAHQVNVHEMHFQDPRMIADGTAIGPVPCE